MAFSLRRAAFGADFACARAALTGTSKKRERERTKNRIYPVDPNNPKIRPVSWKYEKKPWPKPWPQNKLWPLGI